MNKYRLPTQVNFLENLRLQTTWLDPLVVVSLGLISVLGVCGFDHKLTTVVLLQWFYNKP